MSNYTQYLVDYILLYYQIKPVLAHWHIQTYTEPTCSMQFNHHIIHIRHIIPRPSRPAAAATAAYPIPVPLPLASPSATLATPVTTANSVDVGITRPLTVPYSTAVAVVDEYSPAGGATIVIAVAGP
jgi:hypothetical protein